MNLIVNESMTMSSREISELTGKRHDNVRADIQKMGEELSLIFQDCNKCIHPYTPHGFRCPSVNLIVENIY